MKRTNPGLPRHASRWFHPSLISNKGVGRRASRPLGLLAPRLALALSLGVGLLGVPLALAVAAESGSTEQVGEARQVEERDAAERPAAVEEVYSGPQPGEALTGFRVRVVMGEEEGQEVDLVGQAEQSPWALIFIHETTRPSMAVTRAVARYAAHRAEDGLRTAVVFLTADATETENFVRRARQALPENTTIAISLDGLEGPGEYGLNRTVTLTILVGKEGLVTGNFALVQPSVQNDVLPVVEAIIKTLGSGTAPPLERLTGEAARMERPAGGRPGGEASDNEIRSLLQPLIRRDAREEDVRRIAAAVEQRIEGNEVLRNRIGEIAARIVQAGKLENYGGPAAQEVLRVWARKYGAEAPQVVPPPKP